MLSRPFGKNANSDTSNLYHVTVEFSCLSYEEVRGQQLEHPELEIIMRALEGEDIQEATRWSDERDYVMNNGVLYHYNQDAEDPQLVVPTSMRVIIMKEYHDAPTAGHYGAEKTFQRISSKYYFIGTRRYIQEYVKSCIHCQRFKPVNIKPAGLLQTSVPSQQFEVIAVDLVGPLPEIPRENNWVLIVKDTASKWTELVAIQTATAEACTEILIEKIFLRYCTPRKIISDNGVQVARHVMQQVTYCFDIKTPFIPYYHPESNRVERRNKELNTTSETTAHTPSFLTFGRELRSPRDNVNDLRPIVDSEKYIPQITPYLRKLGIILEESKELAQQKQNQRKEQADKARTSVQYNIGDLVLLKSHSLSDAKKGCTSKFAPKRYGPYKVLKTITPTTYELGTCADPSPLIGRYHVSDMGLPRPTYCRSTPESVGMKRTRGRPKQMSLLDNAVGPTRSPEEESVMRQDFETRATRERRLPGCMRNYILEEEEELSM
ncbi:hypothetical protein Trydic_g9794 [Trypoxylus dichotomus]